MMLTLAFNELMMYISNDLSLCLKPLIYESGILYVRKAFWESNNLNAKNIRMIIRCYTS